MVSKKAQTSASRAAAVLPRRASAHFDGPADVQEVKKVVNEASMSDHSSKSLRTGLVDNQYGRRLGGKGWLTRVSGNIRASSARRR